MVPIGSTPVSIITLVYYFLSNFLIDETVEKRAGKATTAESKANIIASTTSKSSWWPLPSATKGSFLDVGVWTPANEEWFQKQLDDIKSGSRLVKTSKGKRGWARFKLNHKQRFSMHASSVHYSEQFFANQLA